MASIGKTGGDLTVSIRSYARELYRRLLAQPMTRNASPSIAGANRDLASAGELEARIDSMANRLGVLESRLNVAPVLPNVQKFSAEPFLARAERRLGVRAADLTDAERMVRQYSFFSEIWADGYETGLRASYTTYATYLPPRSVGRIVDLGCGAGEFVLFLKEQGFSAIGVDNNGSEVARARARGLDVRQAEILAYLKECEEQFAAITLIQVVEHLSPSQIAPLVASAVRCLAPGGVLFFETINARHPLALHGFYTDPTHTRPVSDDYLVYLFQWAGLTSVEIIFTYPNPVHVPRPEDLRFSYYNYCVVGRRPPFSP